MWWVTLIPAPGKQKKQDPWTSQIARLERGSKVHVQLRYPVSTNKVHIDLERHLISVLGHMYKHTQTHKYTYTHGTYIKKIGNKKKETRENP